MTHTAPPPKLTQYLRLMRAHRPIGTLLLLWPTYWALWLAADGTPPLLVLVIFTLGTFFMRSAGCVINDLADRNFDGHVARTKDRPLVAGWVTPREALAVFVVLVTLAAVTVLPIISPLLLVLALIAVFLAASYPFTKRFLAIPQGYLGIAFGFGIPMAFAAIDHTVPAEAWWLLLANIFWAVAYDTEYAMVDRPDDLKIGIKTSAITFGRFDVAAIMLCYTSTLLILAGVGVSLSLSWPYWSGLIVATGIALYHYTLIRDRDTSRCFAAFMHNNWFGAAVFAGILLNTLI
ncbi:MAG: 4-hydroxybenzoate octaprenyltransferase [Rhodocyclales bacterium]|nr:4-hydroxybenzoate octaprenyltransferase [Rhodocyclales bacterium]